MKDHRNGFGAVCCNSLYDHSSQIELPLELHSMLLSNNYGDILFQEHHPWLRQELQLKSSKGNRDQHFLHESDRKLLLHCFGEDLRSVAIPVVFYPKSRFDCFSAPNFPFAPKIAEKKKVLRIHPLTQPGAKSAPEADDHPQPSLPAKQSKSGAESHSDFRSDF